MRKNIKLITKLEDMYAEDAVVINKLMRVLHGTVKDNFDLTNILSNLSHILFRELRYEIPAEYFGEYKEVISNEMEDELNKMNDEIRIFIEDTYSKYAQRIIDMRESKQ